jgi:hypothetical protein
MQYAGIARFTMCFNDAEGGALRLGTPPVDTALGSIGHAHWGLEFRGVSIGNVTASVQFCQDNTSLPDGQEVQCGAIPDSGTTALMGPQEHVDMLLVSICDNWERCTKNYTAMIEATQDAAKAAKLVYGTNPFKMEPLTKAQVFKNLLSDCSLWLHGSSEGLDELPELFFHVAGEKKDQVQSLRLRGRYYIFEDLVEQMETKESDEGWGSTVKVGTGKFRKECSPSFGEMDYMTKQNGPVWILGLPFFYEYVVGYDLSAATPSVSFSSVLETPCEICEGGKKHKPAKTAGAVASLVSSAAATTSASSASTSLLADGEEEIPHPSRWQPRRVTGPRRVSPGIDPTRGHM